MSKSESLDISEILLIVVTLLSAINLYLCLRLMFVSVPNGATLPTPLGFIFNLSYDNGSFSNFRTSLIQMFEILMAAIFFPVFNIMLKKKRLEEKGLGIINMILDVSFLGLASLITYMILREVGKNYMYYILRIYALPITAVLTIIASVVIYFAFYRKKRL